jgi:hypothetical protein
LEYQDDTIAVPFATGKSGSMFEKRFLQGKKIINDLSNLDDLG